MIHTYTIIKCQKPAKTIPVSSRSMVFPVKSSNVDHISENIFQTKMSHPTSVCDWLYGNSQELKPDAQHHFCDATEFLARINFATGLSQGHRKPNRGSWAQFNFRDVMGASLCNARTCNITFCGKLWSNLYQVIYLPVSTYLPTYLPTQRKVLYKSCGICAPFPFLGMLLYEIDLYSRQAYVRQLCNY